VGKGISEVFDVRDRGVAISRVPIIAVILMLFSERARVNGPVFLLGWVLALAVLSGVVYVLGQASNPTTSSSASDTISRGKIVLGVLLLLVALRSWRNRPARDTGFKMPKWMAGIDASRPGRR
jgi:Sap-like sulfolipid-1-addressing protein